MPRTSLGSSATLPWALRQWAMDSTNAAGRAQRWWGLVSRSRTPLAEPFGARTLTLLVLVLFCAGCATSPSYFVLGNSYQSQAEAYARWNELVASARQAVTPLPQPILPRALVALPSDNVLGSYVHGNTSQLSAEQLEFLKRTLHDNCFLFAEAIQTRGVFGELKIQQYEEPEAARVLNAGYLIIYGPPGARSADSWHITDSAEGARKKLYVVPAPRDLTAQVLSFVESVESIARDYRRTKTQ